jgi:dTMP kinase
MLGDFFVFEGVDGSGKSTQAKMFADFLRLRGRDVVEVRDPGSTNVAEQIRTIIKDKNNRNISHKTQMLLFEAARAEMVDNIIRPALKEGKTVVCDRFTDSTLVYQSVMNGLDEEDLEKFNDYVSNGVSPTLTFYFLSDYETFKTRVLSRGEKDNVEIRITEDIFNRMNLMYYRLYLNNQNSIVISSERNAHNSPSEISVIVRTMLQLYLGNVELDTDVLKLIENNGGYCICGSISVPETLCPCREMMDNQRCKCNLFC